MSTTVNSGGFDGEPTNADRAELAMLMLGAAGHESVGRSTIVEAVTSLLHLAMSLNIDADPLLSDAQQRFVIELEEEE